MLGKKLQKSLILLRSEPRKSIKLFDRLIDGISKLKNVPLGSRRDAVPKPLNLLSLNGYRFILLKHLKQLAETQEENLNPLSRGNLRVQI